MSQLSINNSNHHWAILPIYFGASPKPSKIGRAATGRESGMFICSPSVCRSCDTVLWNGSQLTRRHDLHGVGGWAAPPSATWKYIWLTVLLPAQRGCPGERVYTKFLLCWFSIYSSEIVLKYDAATNDAYNILHSPTRGWCKSSCKLEQFWPTHPSLLTPPITHTVHSGNQIQVHLNHWAMAATVQQLSKYYYKGIVIQTYFQTSYISVYIKKSFRLQLQYSSSSRMRVINHNWSATKQRLHPQSV